MDYLDYLKGKLKVVETNSVIDDAVIYLGNEYPKWNSNHKGYEIVDEWFEKIIKKWNIELKTLNLSQPEFLGKLEPKSEGFIVNLNKNLFTTKKRFTIAHEIAHILSYDTFSKWPVYEVRHSKIEEYYCDRIARAMILPKSLIDFDKFNLQEIDKEQIDSIKKLWREFRVSPWQIILKLYEEIDNYSLVCIYWQYFKEELCLRIIDHRHPKNIFIPQKDRVHLGNLLETKKTNQSPAIAFESNDLYQGFDLIEIGSLYKKRLFSTAFPIKTSAANYVIQIIKT